MKSRDVMWAWLQIPIITIEFNLLLLWWHNELHLLSQEALNIWFLPSFIVNSGSSFSEVTCVSSINGCCLATAVYHTIFNSPSLSFPLSAILDWYSWLNSGLKPISTFPIVWPYGECSVFWLCIILLFLLGQYCHPELISPYCPPSHVIMYCL